MAYFKIDSEDTKLISTGLLKKNMLIFLFPFVWGQMPGQKKSLPSVANSPVLTCPSQLSSGEGANVWMEGGAKGGGVWI